MRRWQHPFNYLIALGLLFFSSALGGLYLIYPSYRESNWFLFSVLIAFGVLIIVIKNVYLEDYINNILASKNLYVGEKAKAIVQDGILIGIEIQGGRIALYSDPKAGKTFEKQDLYHGFCLYTFRYRSPAVPNFCAVYNPKIGPGSLLIYKID